MNEEKGYCKACGSEVVRYLDITPEVEKYFHHMWDAVQSGHCELLQKCCIPPDQVTFIEKDDEDLPLEMSNDA